MDISFNDKVLYIQFSNYQNSSEWMVKEQKTKINLCKYCVNIKYMQLYTNIQSQNFPMFFVEDAM